jgi:hypothetical protein
VVARLRFLLDSMQDESSAVSSSGSESYSNDSNDEVSESDRGHSESEKPVGVDMATFTRAEDGGQLWSG